mmetsp:Transcript_423/g.802  ORF Transcript_423/g.802 Transcript_423/m.802 type:complete len:192 (-) Transcript_423:315-890(-)
MFKYCGESPLFSANVSTAFFPGVVKTFEYYNLTLPFGVANEWCKCKGGTLASILSEEEMEAAKRISIGVQDGVFVDGIGGWVWIGLRLKEEEEDSWSIGQNLTDADFFWVDGSPVEYTYWQNDTELGYGEQPTLETFTYDSDPELAVPLKCAELGPVYNSSYYEVVDASRRWELWDCYSPQQFLCSSYIGA